jgi:hypothetical protein
LEISERNKLRVQHQYDAVVAEHDALIGHHNKKQKIRYIATLKEQINELVEENRKLRESK